jgi:NTP pyrophosphatase (non-canonical NTP hydrolase)
LEHPVSQTSTCVTCTTATVSIQELQLEIADWVGPINPGRTPNSTISKLLEEIGELIASERMRDPLELADVAILVLDLFYLQEIDLAQAVKDKMLINRQRTWRIADNGAMQHRKAN